MRTGSDAVRFPPDGPGTPPFPTRLHGFARERIAGRVLELAAPWLVGQGLALAPGHVADDVWWLAESDALRLPRWCRRRTVRR